MISIQAISSNSIPPFHPGGLWLVRPDGYIAVATTENDSDFVADFLQSLVRPSPISL